MVSMTEAIEEELESLWDDLEKARRSAVNGQWSIECDNLVYRIQTLTMLVGPTHWTRIQLNLLEKGIYQKILDEMDITYETPDMQKVAEVRERLNEGLNRW